MKDDIPRKWNWKISMNSNTHFSQNRFQVKISHYTEWGKAESISSEISNEKRVSSFAPFIHIVLELLEQ
jgi:hypothetical protein